MFYREGPARRRGPFLRKAQNQLENPRLFLAFFRKREYDDFIKTESLRGLGAIQTEPGPDTRIIQLFDKEEST